MSNAELVDTIAHILDPWAFEAKSYRATIARDDATDKATQIVEALAALDSRAGDAGEGHNPNAYVLLEPDAEDVRLCLKGAIPACPCCEGTPSTFSRFFPHSGIYQGYVNCSRCHVQVLANARDRGEARGLAIAAWSKRPATPAPAVDAVELAAFGASEHACALYPGADQAAERAAFIAGAAHEAKPAVDAVPAGEVGQ